MSPFYDRKEEGAELKLAAVFIAATAVVVSGWLLLSSPESSPLSGTRAFDQGGAAPPPRVPRAVERRTGTGLDMVQVAFSEAPSATKPEADPTAPAAAAVSAAPAPAPAPAAPAPARAEPPPSDAELAAAGLPVTPSGLTKLGAQKGLLSAAVRKLLDHPRVLKAVLDNKLVVDAVMGRETSRRNCSDPGALKSALSDPRSGAMANLYPLVQQALSKPAAASAMISSELGSRLMECPSTKALTSDPSMMMSVAMANPQALGLVSDPRVAQALASDPRASGLFSQVQTGLGGLGGAGQRK
ncbi:MAG: hypothetical protein SF051_11060 [Elusimicrobiota bacterium]|nr:hypothetical protein [Elusimicrobiota bacterium]